MIRRLLRALASALAEGLYRQAEQRRHDRYGRRIW